MEKFRVNEVSNLLKVSQTTVYKKIKRLKKELSNHSIKEKGILYFTSEGLEVIRQSLTTGPKETTLEAIPPGPLPAVDFSPMVTRFGDIERGILALTEAFRNEAKETKALKESISRLAEDVKRC